MDSAAFNEGVGASQKKLRGFQRDMEKMGRRMQSIGKSMSLALTGPLVGIAYKSVAAQGAQEKALAAVDAALESMGQSAGYNRDQLMAMAGQLQENSLYGDEEILSKVTANLLTFGEVQGEVFDRGQQLALDLSARLGQDLQSSTVMLGKALNSPKEGLSALSRVGVMFTEQQKEQIKAMADAGDAAGAQALMLDELEKQYAGQAEAMANTDSGQMTQAMNAIGDATEKVGAILLPILADMANFVKDLAERFQALSPETQAFIVKGAALAAAIGPVVAGLGLFVAAVAPLVTAIGPLIAILSGPVGLVALAAAAAAALYFNWDEIKAGFLKGVEAVVGFVADFKQTLNDLLASVGEMALDIGRQVIAGIMGGLQEKVSYLKDKVTGLGKWIGSWFADPLEIQSPSRLFRRFGEFITEGLVIGIRGGIGAVRDVVGDLADAVQLTDLGDQAQRTDGLFKSIGDTAQSTFSQIGKGVAGLINKTKTWRDVLADVLKSISQVMLQQAQTNLVGALGGAGTVGGALIGGLFSGLTGFANGGSFEVGGVGGIDSQVVAFRATPDETVTITKPGQVAAGGGVVDVRIALDDDGRLVGVVERTSGAVAARVVAGSLAEYDQGLGDRVRHIVENPRRFT